MFPLIREYFARVELEAEGVQMLLPSVRWLGSGRSRRTRAVGRSG